MNAQNYLKIHIGKLYRYDKKPKYFTEQMVVELMEGYAHHKIKQLDSDNTSLYFSLLDTVNELRKSKEAILELEKDIVRTKNNAYSFAKLCEAYHSVLFKNAELIASLRLEIERLKQR